MAKPAGSRCNLACEYCYYLEKGMMYPAQPAQTMSDELLDLFIRNYIAAQPTPQVVFSWHGGETLLRSKNFYRRVVELQRKYGAGRRIENTIQTNGTLLDDEWCAFFRDNGWLVGISIDGPRRYHDRYRLDRRGGGTFDDVMHGIGLLAKHDVQWNALAVVNRFNGDDPEGFYDFFRSTGCRFLQFTPVVERIMPREDGRMLASAADSDARLADFSVTPGQWGRFLCRVFDRWVTADVGEIFVQMFDATLANWVGQAPGLCTLSKICGHAGALEFNGDLYACDHFVFPEYKLGNIVRTPIGELMRSTRQSAFGDAKLRSLPSQCRECRYLFACNGECPRNRFAYTRTGEPGLNYLCKGYYKFFDHAAPYMDFMRNELSHRRPPSNVMEWARRRLARSNDNKR